jgi:hypothetical protein
VSHCETGTEGELLAFQDARFMNIPVPPDALLICAKCQYCWQKLRGDEEPQGHCHTGKHEWQNATPDGRWSYSGLHILNPGDVLIIFDKADSEKVLWNCKKKKLMVVDHARWGVADPGMRLAGCKNKVPFLKWGKWFREQYPAVLTLGPQSLENWEKHFRIPAEEELKQLGRA